MSTISITTTGEILYKTGCKISVITVSTILYIEYLDEQCTLVLVNGVKNILCCQLKDLLALLPGSFVLANRNQIINTFKK